MRNAFLPLVAAAVFGLVAPAAATQVIYTFESPLFTFGQSTPLLNRTPNVGPATFNASFSSGPSASGFAVSTGAFGPGFSGQILIDPFPPSGADVLTVTVNTPISGVWLDFALFFPGRLELSSSAGLLSASTGPSSQGGVLAFDGGTGFTQFQLRGISTSEEPVQIAIDNLTLTLVPEPSSGALFTAALAAWAALRKRSQAVLA